MAQFLLVYYENGNHYGQSKVLGATTSNDMNGGWRRIQTEN